MAVETSELITAPVRRRRTWFAFLTGPIVGTAYFLAVYLLGEATCARDLDLVGEPTLRTTILVLTVVSAVVGVAAAAQALALRRRGRAAEGAGTTAELDRAANQRFMGATALQLLGLFAYFVALVAAPVIGATLC